MKFEKLSENKIKIILTTQDLAEKDIDLHTFMSNSIESQDLFMDMLEEAENKVGFQLDDCKIRVEALTMANGEFALTVTKVVPETRNIHKKISVKRKNIKHDYRYAIYKFYTLDDFNNFIELLKCRNLVDCYTIAEKIDLYIYKNEYYIVFENINTEHPDIVKFNSAIIEFAQFVSNSNIFISKLNESGENFIQNNAIKTAMKYF